MHDSKHATADPICLPTPVELTFEAAGRLGWPVRVIDGEYGYLWELTLPDGTRRAIVGARTPINDGAATQLASDKHYTALVLAEHGVRVPRTVRALSPRHFRGTDYLDRAHLDDARAFATSQGFPLVVKPNRMSHGRLVRRVADGSQLEAAIAAVWELDRVALVQEAVAGRELRLDLLDGELLAGYERHPQLLVGDGRSTMAELLGANDARFRDPRSLERALPDGLDPERVLAAGEQVVLGDGIHNLNRSARAELIRELPEPWRAWATAVAHHLGLRLAGIDLRIATDGDPLAADPREAVVLEVNATPLLVQLARMGHRDLALEAQTRILRALT